MSGDALEGRYIVAGPAWYRVTGNDADAIYTVVAAGSTWVIGRAVRWHRSELRAMHRLGECRVRDGPPPAALDAPGGDAGEHLRPDGKRK